jgi:hypothetical protein
MACSGFLVSIETSTTPHYLCADQPTDTILHIKQEFGKKIGIPESRMIFIDKNEKVWQNHEIITTNLDLKLMTTPNRPYTETQMDNVSDLLVGAKIGQEYQTEMLDFYLPKLFELSRTQQEEVIKISAENMEKEWNASFEPVVNRLKKDLKRRVQQLVTDKVLLEQEIQRQQSGACAEFDFEKEWEDKIRKNWPYNGYINSTTFGPMQTERLEKETKEFIKNIADEHIICFYPIILSNMSGSGGVSSGTISGSLYIITRKNIYKGTIFEWINVGGDTQKIRPDFILFYQFDTLLSYQFCRTFISCCKNVFSKSTYDQNRNWLTDHKTSIEESFISLVTSIAGTRYSKLRADWKMIFDENGEIKYVNTKTNEISIEPPYDTPPVKYD